MGEYVDWIGLGCVWVGFSLIGVGGYLREFTATSDKTIKLVIMAGMSLSIVPLFLHAFRII